MSADALVLTLETGPVTIKLRPDIAPNHVERVCTLAKEGFYDAAPFGRVARDFMAQVTPQKSSPYPNLKSEFSDLRFLRSICAMARGVQPDSANNQFFIMTTDAAFAPCQYTVWGEVVDGMEHVDALPQGEPPAEPGRIVSARLASLSQ